MIYCEAGMGMGVNFKVTGIEQVIRTVTKATVNDAIKIDRGLQICAGVILRKALKLVPIDKGPLHDSGAVIGNHKPGFGARWSVVFGGWTAPYALYVHEDLTKTHLPPPRRAKWLEVAVRLTRGTCKSIMRRVMVEERYKHVGSMPVSPSTGKPSAT